MVIWLFGLSGAGKTTIGRRVWQLVRQADPGVVFLDGDEVRALVGEETGVAAHTVEARRRSGERLIRLCKLMDRQDLHVICCVLSIFPEQRAVCRREVSAFFSAFVDVPMAQLEARDSKGLYASARAGKIKNVVGVDIPFDQPKDADLVIANNIVGADMDSYAARVVEVSGILSSACERVTYPYTDIALKRESYFYAPFNGQAFFQAWRCARRTVLSEVSPVDEPPPAKVDVTGRPADDAVESAALVEWLWAECEASGAELSGAAEAKLGELVKKFETTHKIHQAYGPQFQAVDRAIYGDLNTYVRFGEILAARHAASGDLRPLNCLLKLLDITTPMIEADTQDLGPRFRRLLVLEANAIETLGAKMELAV